VTDPHPALLAKLVRSVAILALPYEDQVAWLSSLGLGSPEFADELALELEEGAMLSGQFEQAGWLKQEGRQAISELDSLLAERSGPTHEDFWRLEALRDSPEWARIRGVAIRALFAL
jgi:hypothetical protein